MNQHTAIADSPTVAPDSACSPRDGIRGNTQTSRIVRVKAVGINVFVHLHGCTYTSEALHARHDLVGTPLTIQVEEADLRTIVAVLPDGVRLGVLHVRERGREQSNHKAWLFARLSPLYQR